MCNFYSKISNIKFSVVRHSNIYGPYDKFSLSKGHFIGSSIKKAFLKKISFKFLVQEMKKEIICLLTIF